MNICPSCQNILTLVYENNSHRMQCDQCNFSVFVQKPLGDIQQEETSKPTENTVKEEKKTEAPSLMKRATNLGKAVFNHARDGFQKCPPQVYAARLEICNGCDRLIQDESKETCGMCIECGCPVQTKAAWASEGCPIGKWGVYRESQGGCGSCGKNR